ncbi:MAG: hypothetical protein ACTSRI_04985 [Promethearchaeota archaeon]
MGNYYLLGFLFHIRLNSLLTDFFKSRKIKYFSEVAIFYPTWKRADGLLINDNNFVKNIVLKFGLKNIIAIQFEFTFDLTEGNLLEKIIKYQHPNILLVIIETNWIYTDDKKKLPKNINIIYPQNIKVISPSNFPKIIQLKGQYYEEYRELLEYNNISTLDNLKSLIDLDIVEFNKTYELKDYLKDLGYTPPIKSFFGCDKVVKFKSLDNYS